MTDDAKTLRETRVAATHERVSALEGIGAAEKAPAEEEARGGEKVRVRGLEGLRERSGGIRDEAADRGRKSESENAPEPERVSEPDKSRGSRGIEMEIRSMVEPETVGGRHGGRVLAGVTSPLPVFGDARFGRGACNSEPRVFNANDALSDSGRLAIGDIPVRLHAGELLRTLVLRRLSLDVHLR